MDQQSSINIQNISTSHANNQHLAAQYNGSPTSEASSNNTYLMSASPIRTRKNEVYRPKIVTTVGARPACLVNASVTYVGNDQIYAIGGFDQYSDEGLERWFIYDGIALNLSKFTTMFYDLIYSQSNGAWSIIMETFQVFGWVSQDTVQIEDLSKTLDRSYCKPMAGQQAAGLWRRERA